MIKNIFLIGRVKRLKAELDLLKPIYMILNDEEHKWFEQQWDFFSANHENIHQYKHEIDAVISYTQGNLTELSSLLKSCKRNKRTTEQLSFFDDYADLLINKTRSKCNYFAVHVLLW